MEYYRISFSSEYYKKEYAIEIDEENERKISERIEELSESRNDFTVNNLKVDYIDKLVSFSLIRALEHGKISFQNAIVSHIVYGTDSTHLVKKYELGKMLIKSFNVGSEGNLSSIEVVFNFGHDIIKITGE